MAIKGQWYQGTHRLLMHAAIKASGRAGITARELADALLEVRADTIRMELVWLVRGGFVERFGAGTNVDPYRHRITSTCLHPRVFKGMELRAFILVEDCPAGVDEAVLAQDLKISTAAVRKALQGAIDAGMVAMQVVGGRTLRYQVLPVVPPEADEHANAAEAAS